MERLAGKVALVTGASRGIGEALCVRLAREGADLVLNYNPRTADSRDRCEATAAAIREMGRRTLVLGADVAQKAQVDAMMAELLAAWGRIDILVNNAAIVNFVPFTDSTEAYFDRAFGVNVKGPFLCSQAAVPAMIAQGHGKIINIASTASLRAKPGLSVYSATKGAVKMLTRALAVELGRHNINVNAVGPGSTVTAGVEEYLARPGIYQRETAAVPLRRLGAVGDVAGAVAFLASDDARHINGHLLLVDGGMTARSATMNDDLMLD